MQILSTFKNLRKFSLPLKFLIICFLVILLISLSVMVYSLRFLLNDCHSKDHTSKLEQPFEPPEQVPVSDPDLIQIANIRAELDSHLSTDSPNLNVLNSLFEQLSKL